MAGKVSRLSPALSNTGHTEVQRSQLQLNEPVVLMC